MKAVEGRQVAINTSKQDIDGTVRLTKDTNMVQLVTGNHVTVYTDQQLKEETIFKAGINLMAHQAKSIVFKGSDWPFQLRLEDIS